MFQNTRPLFGNFVFLWRRGIQGVIANLSLHFKGVPLCSLLSPLLSISLNKAHPPNLYRILIESSQPSLPHSMKANIPTKCTNWQSCAYFYSSYTFLRLYGGILGAFLGKSVFSLLFDSLEYRLIVHTTNERAHGSIPGRVRH